MRTPAAEVEIDAALVERLVAEQFPELAAPVRILANGWDNTVARLGGDLVVRMPRRAVAVPLLANEARWLPVIAPLLPVPVPAPIRVGAPGSGYPWAWTIAPWIEGHPVTGVRVADRRMLAADLGRVRAALHVTAPPDAPINPVRGVPLATRVGAVEERLASGAAAPIRSVLRAAIADALDAPEHGGEPVWIHGDPHPGNLLATDAGRLAALVDFGDLARGDPATDLAIAWTAFDADARAAYRETLDPDEPLWRRARGWAAVIASALAVHSDDHPVHAEIAAHTIAQLAAD